LAVSTDAWLVRSPWLQLLAVAVMGALPALWWREIFGFDESEAFAGLPALAVSAALVGLALLVLFLCRKDRQPSSGVVAGVVALAFLGGFLLHGRVAIEVWNLRCRRMEAVRYCYHAARRLGVFVVDDRDPLGRECIGAEYPVACRYLPHYDARSCRQVAQVCARHREGWSRKYAAVEAVCAEWADTCARSFSSPKYGREPGRPPGWPPPPPPRYEARDLADWLRVRDAGPEAAR